MIEVTVKTLDSNVYHFSVADELTVKEFKEHIATEVNVAWDKQRIIFCGKVLQDERRLIDCNVSGKTVHLVQRLPQFAQQPGNNGSGAAGTSTPDASSGTSRTTHLRFPASGHSSVVVEAIAMQPEGFDQNDNLGQVLRQVVSSMSQFLPTAAMRPNDGGRDADPGSQSVHSRLLNVAKLMRMAYSGLSALESPPRRNSSQNAESTDATEPPSQDSSQATAPTTETPRDPNRPFSTMSVQEIRSTQELPRLLATIYDEMDYLQSRLQPFLSRYRSLLASENITSDQLNEEGTRRLTNRVSEVTHSVSHINHLLSDLDIDTRNPRNLVVRSGSVTLSVQDAVSINYLSDLRPEVSTNPAQPQAESTTETSPTTQAESTPSTPNSRTTTPAANTTTTQRFSFLYPSFVSRMSNATSRGVNLIRLSSGGGSTPSREDTTASNTTTATTDTPTTAGGNMNGSSPSQTTPPPSRRITFAAASPSNITMGPPIVLDSTDPYLFCNSPWFRRGGSIQPMQSATFRAEPMTGTSSSQTSSQDSPSHMGTPNPDLLAANAEAILRSVIPGLETLATAPLSQLMNSLFSNVDTDPNIFLLDLMNMLAAQFSVGDLLQLMIRRNYDSLNRLRAPFQQFLNERLLNGETESLDNLEQRVSRVVTQCLEQFEVEEMRNQLFRADIDLRETLTAFLTDRLTSLFRFTLSSPDTPDFGRQLSDRLYDFIVNSLSLLATCSLDPSQSVSGLLNSAVGSDNHLVSSLLRRAETESHNLNSNLRRFIVRTHTPPSTARYEQMDIDNETTPLILPVIRPVVNASGATTTPVATDRSENPVDHDAALEALRAAVPVGTSPESSTSWDVPVGWAPIIARDVNTPHGQQRPLSDAYLEGMPSKRRRLMKFTNPSRLSDVTASLQEAIQRAGVRPRTTSEAFYAEVDRNKNLLQTALQRSIRDRLARRLTEDRDFETEKFPNSKRMTE